MSENNPRPNRVVQRKARALAASQDISYTTALAQLSGENWSAGEHLEELLAPWTTQKEIIDIFFEHWSKGGYTTNNDDGGCKHTINSNVFVSEQHMHRCLQATLQHQGRDLPTPENPSVEISLRQRHRLSVVGPPLSQAMTFALRVFHPFDFVLAGQQMVDAALEDQIRLWMQQKKRIVISGATCSGKTTLLNYILNELTPPSDIIVTEDTKWPEIQSNFAKHTGMHSMMPPGLTDDFELTPEQAGSYNFKLGRIRRRWSKPSETLAVIGETRSFQQVDYLAFYNGPFLTTLHADSAQEAQSTMKMLSQKQVGELADVYIHMERRQNKDNKYEYVIAETMQTTSEQSAL